MSFTFYQLVRSENRYVLRPYLIIYPEMVEIHRYV